MVMKAQHMWDIANYIKTISCIESNEKEAKFDFTVNLIDTTEVE